MEGSSPLLCKCGGQGHVLVVGFAVLAFHLSSMMLKVFSNLNDPVILYVFFPLWNSITYLLQKYSKAH